MVMELREIVAKGEAKNRSAGRSATGNERLTEKELSARNEFLNSKNRRPISALQKRMQSSGA